MASHSDRAGRTNGPLLRFLHSRIHGATRRDEGQGGAVAVMIALFAAILAGMAAFAVDIGYAYAVKRQLSVTADASALSGAQAAAAEFARAGRDCGADLEEAARVAAVSTHNENGPAGSDGDPSVAVECGDGVINVTVANSSTLPTFFGQLWGADGYYPPGRAVAQVSGSPAYSGLRPFAVCQDEVNNINPEATYQSVYGDGADESTCNFAPPGNWGLVDFDGGSNPTGDIQDWTLYGYDGAVTIPDPAMAGDPGANFNSSQIKDALEAIVGETVLLPVASVWQPAGGNNGNFNAIGVLSATICGVKVKTWEVPGDCWDQAQADEIPSPFNGMALQWKFDAYSTSYQSNGSSETSCDLSQATCLPAIRLWE